jgi:hypothetical protein
MKQTFFSIIIFVNSIFFMACERDTCFYSTGEKIRKILISENYTTILNYGMFDIELVQDTTYYVEGIGGSNVIENIEALVKNDTLSLYDYNSCFWLRDYKRPLIRIHFSDIKRINLYETSYVFSTDSITDSFWLTAQCFLAEANLLVNNQNMSFYVHHKTAGQYIFKGKTENLYLDGYYSSILDASGLESKNAKIKNHSIADFKVWATEKLDAEIYNKGNIFFKGSPSVIIDTVQATGKLIPL